MREHKFKIGQLVHYYPKRQAPVVLAPGLYQIVRRLPLANGERSGIGHEAPEAARSNDGCSASTVPFERGAAAPHGASRHETSCLRSHVW